MEDYECKSFVTAFKLERSLDSSWLYPVATSESLYYVRGIDELHLSFRWGSRHFELLMKGTHFPDVLQIFQNHGDSPPLKRRLRAIVKLITSSIWFEGTKAFGNSLETYRHVWLISVDRTREDHVTGICRGPQIGRCRGYHVDIPGLPLYAWDEVEVVAPLGPDRYKVLVQGRQFGCVVSRNAGLLSRQFPMWQAISGSKDVFHIHAPKLRGLIRSDRFAQDISGILYDWIEPAHGSTSLESVELEIFSLQRRQKMYDQIKGTVQAVHDLNFQCVTNWVKTEKEAAKKIILDQKGNANFRWIEFGLWEAPGQMPAITARSLDELKFVTDEDYDAALLDHLWNFLRLSPGTSNPNVSLPTIRKIGPFLTDPSGGSRKGHSPWFDKLPKDVRVMIYEILLPNERLVMYRHGALVRRHTLEPKTWRSRVDIPLKEQTLFWVSKLIRQEARSFFVTRSDFYVEAVELPAFLDFLGDHSIHLRSVIVLVILSEDRTISSVQSAGIDMLRQTAAALRTVEVVVHNRMEDHWFEQMPITALYKFRRLAHFHVSRHSVGFSEWHIDKFEQDARDIMCS